MSDSDRRDDVSPEAVDRLFATAIRASNERIELAAGDHALRTTRAKVSGYILGIFLILASVTLALFSLLGLSVKNLFEQAQVHAERELYLGTLRMTASENDKLKRERDSLLAALTDEEVGAASPPSLEGPIAFDPEAESDLLSSLSNSALATLCQKERTANACNALGHRKSSSSPTEAADSFERACALGSGDGCSNWGYILMWRVEPAEKNKALELFETSCNELNVAQSCHYLGYFRRLGIKDSYNKDMDESYSYYRKACFLGRTESCGSIIKHFSSRLRVDPRSMDVYARACGGGDLEACRELYSSIELSPAQSASVSVVGLCSMGECVGEGGTCNTAVDCLQLYMTCAGSYVCYDY